MYHNLTCISKVKEAARPRRDLMMKRFETHELQTDFLTEMMEM